MHHSLCIILSNMVLRFAVNIPDSGLGLLPLQAALSMSSKLGNLASNYGRALSSNHVASELQVYNICDGSDVYEDEFYNIARDARGICQPTLILVALRLGIDRVTPIYWDAVKEIIRSRNSIGVAG